MDDVTSGFGPSPPSRTLAITQLFEPFDIPDIPEITKRAHALHAARLALIAGDVREARRLAVEANRYGHLARVRLAMRRQRGSDE